LGHLKTVPRVTNDTSVLLNTRDIKVVAGARSKQSRDWLHANCGTKEKVYRFAYNLVRANLSAKTPGMALVYLVKSLDMIKAMQKCRW